ncbi:nucleoside deaminase [bacterium]|nr:nucleoside deaminase [bacterium]
MSQAELRIKDFLKQTLELTKNHLELGQGGPFGAIVVQGDKIVGRGFNKVTSLNDPTAHAEVQAIRDACKTLSTFQLSGCEIFSTCEPCPMCLGAIYWARPKALYFASSRLDAADAGFDDDFIYKEIVLPLDQRSIPTVHVATEGHTDVFQAWKLNEDRVDY